MRQIDDGLQELARRLRAARRVTILTGAGVSAASGVPTFRGVDGLWRQYQATELATPQAFAKDPKRVWEWYAWRREKIAGCLPNPAHDVLAAWSRRPSKWQVVTQNVDDLHVRAGTVDLVRLHGSIWELACWSRCEASRRGEDGSGAVWRDERVPFPKIPPQCPHCGALARPAVVWFGESLNASDLRRAEAAATECEVFVTAGTSAIVYPAAGFVHAAKARGAFTAEINLEPTAASNNVDVAIYRPAEEVLPELDSLL